MALVWLIIHFSKWYITYLFEMIFWNYFLSLKNGLCWPSLRDYLLFDIMSAQSAERFFMIPVSKWYMTVISKWGGKIFVHRIIFVMRTPDILLTKIQLLLLFSYTAFYARLSPYPCVEIKFLEKGDGLLCQILIILQC